MLQIYNQNKKLFLSLCLTSLHESWPKTWFNQEVPKSLDTRDGKLTKVERANWVKYEKKKLSDSVLNSLTANVKGTEKFIKDIVLYNSDIEAIQNNKEEMIRLQVFLKKKKPNLDIAITWDYDKKTEDAINEYRKEKTGFLSSAFAYKQTKDIEWYITEEPLTNIWDIKEWDKILIDFWKNTSAYWKVGAWDMLSENIKVVKITDEDWNTRIWVRWIQSNKVWYYDKKWYIPVFNNYIIEIPTKDEEKTLLTWTDNKELYITQWNEDIAKNEYINNLPIEEARKLGVRGIDSKGNESFIEEVTKLAKAIERSYWIPWKVTLWQAAFESNFWKSRLSRNGLNFFWMRWKGKSFKNYANMEESFLDYARLLTKNPRYRKAFKYATDINPKPEYYSSDYNPSDYNPRKFLETIINSWYAEKNINYAGKVMSLLERKNIA